MNYQAFLDNEYENGYSLLSKDSRFLIASILASVHWYNFHNDGTTLTIAQQDTITAALDKAISEVFEIVTPTGTGTMQLLDNGYIASASQIDLDLPSTIGDYDHIKIMLKANNATTGYLVGYPRCNDKTTNIVVLDRAFWDASASAPQFHNIDIFDHQGAKQHWRFSWLWGGNWSQGYTTETSITSFQMALSSSSLINIYYWIYGY